jgi:hypothetical protein
MPEEPELEDKPVTPHVMVVVDEQGRLAMYVAPPAVSSFLTRGLGGPSWIAEGFIEGKTLLDTFAQIADARRKGVPLKSQHPHESVADPKIQERLEWIAWRTR